jgi:large subunit ribosomal protein L21
MFAVIKTGGKQYCVRKGDVLEVERIKDAKEGAKISFETLFRGEGEKVEIGTPVLSTSVEGKFISEKRDKKKIVFRFHSKTRYRKLKGHRQTLACVEITKI